MARSAGKNRRGSEKGNVAVVTEKKMVEIPGVSQSVLRLFLT
jgi:hypothetical protein